MIGMDEGARRANAELRVQGERRDRAETIKLLREIRDSLKRIEEMFAARIGPIIPKKITPDIVPLDDGGLAQKAQKPPKEDASEPEPLPDPPDPSQSIRGES